MSRYETRTLDTGALLAGPTSTRIISLPRFLLLASLPSKRARAACVDARDLRSSIGDGVHFDTASPNEIGRRYAEKYLGLR